MQRSDTARVGYVVKRYPRYSETFIVNEILAHEAAGLDIEIFALRGPEDTHFQDIISRVRAPVTYLPDRLQKTTDFWLTLCSSADACPTLWAALSAFTDTDPREIAHGAALAALVRTRGITHLHAHFATSATTAVRIASRVTGIPYTFTAHAKDIFHESVDDAELGAKIADAHALVTVSDFNLTDLRRRFPEQADRIRRIYNGLDLQRFVFRPARERPPTIIGVGRLVEKKGFDYLVEACAQLREDGVEFDCQIVGTGDQQTIIEQRIALHGLADRVRLVGARPQRELMDLIQSGAVLAAPCVIGADGNRDGLPTVLLEAMALGTPCVATDVTGMREALLDGRTGDCIPQRDTHALAAALRRFLVDPALRERTALAARSHVEALFDVERNATELRRLFDAAQRPAQRIPA